MDRTVTCALLCLLLATAALSQTVCYRCQNCGSSSLEAVVCGGSVVGPTYPTTYPTTPVWTTTVAPWYPTVITVPPWPRTKRANGYVCYRVQRYVPSTFQYVVDRGCALQLQTYETTCNSVTGYQGYRNCEFCDYNLCNY